MNTGLIVALPLESTGLFRMAEAYARAPERVAAVSGGLLPLVEAYAREQKLLAAEPKSFVALGVRVKTPSLPFPPNCPGAQQPLSVEQYLEHITGAWHETVEGIFKQARICAHADENLDDCRREELIERLPFERTRFVKLAKIGRDQRLQDPRMLPLLPDHHTILYEVSGLNDEELTSAVAAKILHPNMSRKKFIDWKRTHRGQGRADEQNADIALSKRGPSATLLLQDMREDDVKKFKQELVTLCEAYGVGIIYSHSRRP